MEFIEMKVCPVCKTPVYNLTEVGSNDQKRGCDNCKRIWHWLGDMWVSEARSGRLKREPKPGDSIDDFFEPI